MTMLSVVSPHAEDLAFELYSLFCEPKGIIDVRRVSEVIETALAQERYDLAVRLKLKEESKKAARR